MANGPDHSKAYHTQNPEHLKYQSYNTPQVPLRKKDSQTILPALNQKYTDRGGSKPQSKMMSHMGSASQKAINRNDILSVDNDPYQVNQNVNDTFLTQNQPAQSENGGNQRFEGKRHQSEEMSSMKRKKSITSQANPNRKKMAKEQPRLSIANAPHYQNYIEQQSHNHSQHGKHLKKAVNQIGLTSAGSDEDPANKTLKSFASQEQSSIQDNYTDKQSEAQDQSLPEKNPKDKGLTPQ